MAEESFIILNDVLIKAVSSIGFQTEETQESTFLLNSTGFNRKIAAPPKTTCNIEKYLILNDFVKTLTGNTAISGQFIHEEKALDFSDGVISSYNVSASNGSLPSISFSIDIFGDFKPGEKKSLIAPNTTEEEDVVSGLFGAPTTGFSINIDNSSNFVQSFNYSVDFNISPTYEIDSIKSSTVKILPPVTYQANAVFEVNNETLEDVTGLLNSETFNRTVFFDVGTTGSIFQNIFSVPNASLRSQSITQNAADTTQISLSFVGYST
jgi:hypothetical protein